MIPWLSDPTLRTIAAGAATLGAVSGVLGSFALLRRQSLLGDAVAHAALPGVAAAFLIAGSKAPMVLMGGAACAGLLATLAVSAVVRLSRVRFDAALGVALSTFFGLGLVLLSAIQKRPDASQAGLDRFLFGQAAALLREDVHAMLLLGAAALAAVAALWKEFKILAFDRDYGESLGLPVGALDVALTALIVVAVVIGLQTVGVVLMSAMVVAPAAAARQWARRLGTMVVLAGGFGAAAGLAGALLSAAVPRLPTGPTIVLLATAWVAVSLVVAPGRGLLWRFAGTRPRVEAETVLQQLHALSLQHDEGGHAHEEGVLRALARGRAGLAEALAQLEREGLAERTEGARWRLTEKGRARAGAARHPERRR
ncbi:MAG: metal ABC transporter permease [Acidobacteria bacterium]|nr:MAG: metal ABC transporter permease [Acidobacteriota bacterium]